MVVLLENEFFMSGATWVWGEEAEVCVEALPMMNEPCWSGLFAKSIGILIILGSCMNKVPIILNILNAKSTEGMSRGSVYGEQIMYANAFFYGFLSGHPLTAFGENGALLIQNVVIVLLLWQFEGGDGVSLMERGLVSLATAIYLVIVRSFLREESLHLLMAVLTPMMVYAKGSQIWSTYQVKHMGSQSIITTGMNVVGNLLRVFTTLKEIGFDIPTLGVLFLALLLNAIPMGQHFYYQKNTEEFLRKLKAKKQD